VRGLTGSREGLVAVALSRRGSREREAARLPRSSDARDGPKRGAGHEGLGLWGFSAGM
jgi:hypothetical protein